MNNTFNISRFGKFFAMELRRCRKILLILMGITLLGLVMDMVGYEENVRTVQETVKHLEEQGIDTIGLGVSPTGIVGITTVRVNTLAESAKLGVSPLRTGGAFGFLLLIIPFILYNFVYHPTKSFTYSMLPASWLEKFASAWVMCVIFVPFLLFGFSLFVGFIGDLLGAQVSYHAVNWSFFTGIFLTTVAAQAIMSFWGTFWFKRQKIGKTILTFVVIVFALIFLIFALQHFGVRQPEGMYHIAGDGRGFRYLAYGLMALLWTISLIKFRRTQI